MYRSFFKRTSVLILLIPALGFHANAQKETRDEATYRKTSAELRKDIWSWDLPQFANRTVPPQYEKSSSVVLARHVDLSAGSTNKAFDHGGFRPRKEFSITEVTRELVKLNDAAAIKEYSEMSYTALKKPGGSISTNSYSTFIGVRVIKQNGTVKEIDLDDIVLTKDEKEEKQAKLAIPDLQPGDIIDYYMANEVKEQQYQTANTWPYYFTFIDDAPVLDYSVHCEISPKYAIEYKRYNGAPDFTTRTDEDGYNILDVSAKNLQLYPAGIFWISPFRQFPLIQLNVVMGYQGIMAGRINARTPGEIYKDESSEKILFDEFMAVGAKKGSLQSLPQLVKKSDGTKEVYKELLNRKEDVSDDTLAAALYYMFRYDVLFNVGANINVGEFVNISERKISPSAFSYLLMEYFNANKVDAELLLSSSKYRPRIGEVMSKNDILYLVNVPTAKSPIFGANNFYSCAFYIPAEMENATKAVALDPNSVAVASFRNAKWHPVDIPASMASANVHTEHLVVEPDLSGDAVKVARTTSLTGHYKDEIQPNLLLLEDFYNYERTFYNETQTLVEKYAEKKRSRKLSEELEAAFAEARKKQKDAFTEEAKEFFELEVKDLAGQKIVNPGVRHTSPAFVYSSSMNIQGLVKRAGNNYILEIGKLSGSPLKVEEKQRDRKLDVYGPFARKLKVETTLKIPDGYTAEGVDKLSRTVTNDNGSFVVTAKLEGNNLNITTERIYNNAMEPASAWPKLLDIIDAAYDWSNAKVLLKKI